MEFSLRCNDLKCRAQLHDRAVVTTCSHVFCTQCADTTGLSRSTNAHRTCPACRASLQNPDDVVITGLNPLEDYKTSVLSGLSPTIIMECASRGMAFHAYQTSQEIIYQEHLAKGLTDKYNVLSQQMDQLIHDANAQIKAMQEKMQAMAAEQASLESKNHELIDAYKEKSISQQKSQKLYQTLKAQVMASHVANAAGDEAELTFQTARGDRFIDRLPGTRTSATNFNHAGPGQCIGSGWLHNRADSRSSENSGQQRGGVGFGQAYASHLQGRILGSRMETSQSIPVGTPSQAHRSRLPVLGGTRQSQLLNPESNATYQASPITRQPLGGGGVARNLGSFTLGSVSKRSRKAI